jgi:hypothetical protein
VATKKCVKMVKTSAFVSASTFYHANIAHFKGKTG